MPSAPINGSGPAHARGSEASIVITTSSPTMAPSGTSTKLQSAGWFGTLAKKYPQAVKKAGMGGANIASVLQAERKFQYGAEGQGPSIYAQDPEGNTVELKGPPWPAGAPG